MQKVDLPESQIGRWRIEKFTVTENGAGFFNLRSIMNGYRDGYMYPGEYTRLKYGNEIVMSDTPSEMDDHAEFVYKARGKILINGLGLGVVIKNLLLKSDVTYIHVNEKYKEVIDLVSLYYTDPRLHIEHADAYTWKPEKDMKFDYIWHDIWNNFCTDNLILMAKLHERYACLLSGLGYQDSWRKKYLESIV